LSPSMVAAAQASQDAHAASNKAAVKFVAGDIATWGKETAHREQFDLATSFMALHWVNEADLPATLSGLRAALAHPKADAQRGTPERCSWFIGSFHGDNSMRSLFDAVNATVDATTRTSSDITSADLKSWGQAGAAVAAARWRDHFPDGSASWRPITMLPATQWRQLLHDAGFNVDEGVVQIRCVAVAVAFLLTPSVHSNDAFNRI